MPFVDGERYEATVLRAFPTESATKGTPAIHIVFETEAGRIETDLWVTPNTKERVLDTLEILGCSRSRVFEPGVLDRIGDFISGTVCSIVIAEEEYKGNLRAVVKWINEPKKAMSGDAVSRMYGLLGGPVGRRGEQQTITPSDIGRLPANFMDDPEVPF